MLFCHGAPGGPFQHFSFMVLFMLSQMQDGMSMAIDQFLKPDGLTINFITFLVSFLILSQSHGDGVIRIIIVELFIKISIMKFKLADLPIF